MVTDAVAVAPQVYAVALENDRVRVLDARGKVGAKSARHHHPASVTIVMTDCTLRVYSQEGETMDIELKAGQVLYSDAEEHSIEVVGAPHGGEARMFIVELKER